MDRQQIEAKIEHLYSMDLKEGSYMDLLRLDTIASYKGLLKFME